MSIVRTQLTKDYHDVVRCEMFVTEKYKLPLYAFSLVDNDNKKFVIKYYILSKDLGQIVNGYNDSPIKAYNVKKNCHISSGFLDYVLFENETYISSSLILRSSSLTGWGIDMDELIRDIQNATVADEMNYAEAIRDFSEYQIKTQRNMLINVNDLKAIVKKSYNFLDESYIEEIINLIIDNAVINFALPYNKLEFKNNIKHENLEECFDFILEVVQSYKDEFLGRKEDVSSKEEIKKIESDIAQKQYEEKLNEFNTNMNNNFDITSFLDANILFGFKEEMFGAFCTKINDNRRKNGLPEITHNNIRQSIHYRSSYIEYGRKYKDICMDDNYCTDECYLMSMFFMDYIFYNGETAYHNEFGTKIPFLRKDNDTTYALLTESEYKGLLLSKVKFSLLHNVFKVYPEYQLTTDDWNKIKNFVRAKLFCPERVNNGTYGVVQKVQTQNI